MLIASGFRILAESLAANLNGVGGLAVSPCCGDFQEVAREITHQPPDLLLIDVYHDREAAFGLAVDLRLKLPELKIMVLGVADTRDARRCVEAACSGFVRFDCSLEQLREAIARVLRGEEVYPDPSRGASWVPEGLAIRS
ncbi:MAG: response regulator transcription factor [bacterium]|nr:response regulator transcription factor [bacterium]